MHLNADRMANNVDMDQTAPWGRDWAGSALFAQTYLTEMFGSLCNTFEYFYGMTKRNDISFH